MGGSGRLLVSVHDVSEGTVEAAQAWARHLDDIGVPVTFLAVAGPFRGPALTPEGEAAGWLRDRQLRGDEIAVHGWFHAEQPGSRGWRRALARPLASGAAELAAVDEAQARRILERCVLRLAAAGLRPLGLTPPGYLLSPSGRTAARHVGLRYTTSHLAVHDALEGRIERIPAFCHRPGTRLERPGAALLTHAVAALARADRSVRIGLHPDDLERPGLRTITLTAIEAALTAGLRPMTYRDSLDHREAAR